MNELPIKAVTTAAKGSQPKFSPNPSFPKFLIKLDCKGSLNFFISKATVKCTNSEDPLFSFNAISPSFSTETV